MAVNYGVQVQGFQVIFLEYSDILGLLLFIGYIVNLVFVLIPVPVR